MTHETAREALLDLAYGELPAREAREVEAHAAGCDECGAALRRLRETRALVSALPPEPAPEAGERILLAAAREAVRDRRRRRWMPSWLWRGTIAAVTAAAAVALSYRLYALRPARLEREDPDALLGAAPERAPTQAARPDGEAKAEASGGASTSGALAHAPAAGERRTDGAASASRLDERSVVTRRKEPVPSAPPAEERAAAEREVPEPPQAFAAAPGPAPALRAPAAARAPTTDRAAALAEAGAGEESASPPAARRAAAPAAAASPAAATPVAAGADPVARHRQLRAAGALRREVATFPGCEGEAWREVQRDPEGRVVRYARRGAVNGVPFEAELYYGEDGALRVVRYREAEGGWREARLSGPGAVAPGIPAAVAEPRRAADAGLEAPGRCR